MKELLKQLKGKWSNLDKALALIHPITGANVSVTGVPIVRFLVQCIMEVEIIPMGALLEVDPYTVVEVWKSEVVRMHSNVQRYWDCCCDPNVGRMGYEDLMVALVRDISNIVVVLVNTRATEGL